MRTLTLTALATVALTARAMGQTDVGARGTVLMTSGGTE